MIKFENIEYLYALALIPLFIVLLVAFIYWRKQALRKFGDGLVTAKLMPLMSANKKIYKFIFLMVAYAFLVIGAANPHIGFCIIIQVKRF